MKHNKLRIFLFTAIFVFGLAFSLFEINHAEPPPIVTKANSSQQFSYKGKEGIDALTVLQALATVTQDQSGLIIAINGRKAENSKHEYWAFYVNGKMAQVGPKDYRTRSTDSIMWKITTY